MNDLKKLYEKIQRKQLEKATYKWLIAHYKQKENAQIVEECEKQYKKLCKTCAKLVEKYNNLLHSNNETYTQLDLFSYNNNKNI